MDLFFVIVTIVSSCPHMAHYTIVCESAKATYVQVNIAQYCRYDFLIT